MPLILLITTIYLFSIITPEGDYRNSRALIGREWRHNYAIVTSAEVIIAGGQIFKTAASRFVNSDFKIRDATAVRRGRK